MATQTWTWSGEDPLQPAEKPNLPAGSLGGRADRCAIACETLEGGLRQGVERITVDNGLLRFSVLPTRGMGLWKAWLGDRELGWHSPNRGPVHPAFVPLAEPSGLGWLEGFDELLVRCGLISNGAPEFDEEGRVKYPLHGRIANRPARQVSVSVDEESGLVQVSGVVEETRFLFHNLRMTSTYTTRAGEPWIAVRDEIENLSASPAEIQMLYHTNFGPPLLEEGAEVVSPLETVVPRDARAAEGLESWSRYGQPEAGFHEQVYFIRLKGDASGQTMALLKNASGSAGASLQFNLAQLPCFTVWKNTTALSDGYVTGLEPGTNYPNTRSYEGRQGRIVKLPPAGRQLFELRLAAHGSAEEVRTAQEQIEKLQGNEGPQVFEAPQPGWCGD